MNKKYDYSEEKVNFLKEKVKGTFSYELADMFNKEFNCNIDATDIAKMKRNLKLTSGMDTKFKKGQLSYNKGKKMSKEQYEKCKNTMFKKGNRTYNTRKLFDERIDADGYTYIKVKEPNKWVLKHRWLYEKEKGKIPKGHKLIFADGNKQNLELDNLILVSDAELFIINQKKLYKKDKQLTKSGVAIAKLIDKVNKTKNGVKNG